MSLSIKPFYNWYRSILRNPKYRWWIILGTFAYLFSPFDIAPDFLPIVGQLDDVMLLTLLASELSSWVIDYGKSRQQGDTATADQRAVEVDAIPVE